MNFLRLLQIEYSYRLIILPKFQQMIIKSPSKRVSHLDLKFLDLKIVSVDADRGSYTVPLPFSKTIHKHNHKVSDMSLNNSLDKTKICNMKLGCRQTSLFQQNTNDVTSDQNNQYSIISARPGDTINTNDVLNYLTVDSESVYREVDNRIKKQQFSINPPGKNIDAKVKMYKEQIKTFEKQNSLIHNQILKIYSSKLGEKNLQAKITRNMKILANKKNQPTEKVNPLQQHYQQMSQSLRYKSEGKEIQRLKRNFFEKFKSSQMGESEFTQLTPLKQQKQCEQSDMKQYKSTNRINKDKMKLIVEQKLNKKQAGDIHLPVLIKNKYENFYQDLYKSKKQKIVSKDANTDAQKLGELKKKMISNNFDKDFLQHVEKKKLRVPEFLKNLR